MQTAFFVCLFFTAESTDTQLLLSDFQLCINNVSQSISEAQTDPLYQISSSEPSLGSVPTQALQKAMLSVPATSTPILLLFLPKLHRGDVPRAFTHVCTFLGAHSLPSPKAVQPHSLCHTPELQSHPWGFPGAECFYLLSAPWFSLPSFRGERVGQAMLWYALPPPLPSPQQRLGVGGRLSAISSLGVSLSSQPCWEEKSAVGLGQAPSTRKSRVL